MSEHGQYLCALAAVILAPPVLLGVYVLAGVAALRSVGAGLRWLISLVALLLAASAVGAQPPTLADRLEQLDRNTVAINALSARLASLEAKVDALTGNKAPASTGAARVSYGGCEWEWDTGLGVYRPVEPGWTYVPSRNVWRQAPPSPQPMYLEPGTAPRGFVGTAGGCANGSCTPAAAGPARARIFRR